MKDEFIRIGLSSGHYEIPMMRRCDAKHVKKLISFNFCMNRPRYKRTVHFFIPDKEFVRVWNAPQKYVSILERFNGCFSPDFSIYRDMPVALQIYNTFRNRWCGRLWQESGLKVIPTIGWADERSYEFAFAGVERGSTVAISTRGAIREKVATELFVRGYEAMMEALAPEEIIVFGVRLEGLRVSGNIRWYEYDFKKTEALGEPEDAQSPETKVGSPEIRSDSSEDEIESVEDKDDSPEIKIKSAETKSDSPAIKRESPSESSPANTVDLDAVESSKKPDADRLIPHGAVSVSVVTDRKGLISAIRVLDKEGRMIGVGFRPPISRQDFVKRYPDVTL